MPEPIFPGTYKPPTEPRWVLRRIKARAHELAQQKYVRAYQAYIAAMLMEREAGALAVDAIQFWEPSENAR